MPPHKGKNNRTLLRRFRRLECEQLEERNLLTSLTGAWSAGPVAPGGIGTMLLLSDGTAIAQFGAYWSRLSPDAHGSYANGSWYAMPQSMNTTQRLYFGSALLPSGSLVPLSTLQSGQIRQDANSNVLANVSGSIYQLSPSNAQGNYPATFIGAAPAGS